MMNRLVVYILKETRIAATQAHDYDRWDLETYTLGGLQFASSILAPLFYAASFIRVYVALLRRILPIKYIIFSFAIALLCASIYASKVVEYRKQGTVNFIHMIYYNDKVAEVPKKKMRKLMSDSPPPPPSKAKLVGCNQLIIIFT